MMVKKPKIRKPTKQQLELYQRMMSERMGPKIEMGTSMFTVPVDHSTNWNADTLAVIGKEKRPYLMGEGLGSSFFSAPKYTVVRSSEEQEALEKAELEYKLEMKILAKRKRERMRKSEKALKKMLPDKIETSKVLVHQRIFHMTWARKDWETRANKCGGLLEGIDVAKTDYGRLLIVPVIEEEEAKDLGLLEEKVPKKRQLRDLDGRRFWVAAEIKEFVQRVFGSVRWNRPLSISEAEQFGVGV